MVLALPSFGCYLRNKLLQRAADAEYPLKTLIFGPPEFKTKNLNIPKGMSLIHLGMFMIRTFTGRLNKEKIKLIRDRWKGKYVLKGVATEKAVALGLDGIIVSNHGGRQLDAGETTIAVLPSIAQQYGDQIKLMMDSDIRTDPDIASTLGSGAIFTFLGRSLMYGVAAMVKKVGHQVISILKKQLQQDVKQICCERPSNLHKHKMIN